MDPQATTTARLLSLWQHLGLDAAHVATQMPGDVADLAAAHPQRIAGLIFCAPARLDPAPFASLSGRLLLICGETGITSTATGRALKRLAGARRVVLGGYDAPGWADVVADRREEIIGAITAWIGGKAELQPAATHLERKPSSGTYAGITYSLQGSGPALVLLPFFLAPSQWAPALDALARHFTVIVLGGAWLGGVAALEDRARTPSYGAMFDSMIDLMQLGADDRVLDVGCGSGALDRRLVRRRGSGGGLVACDVNPFLLREARTLAAAEGISDAIAFVDGNAEALPFADSTFDGIFSVTVLEECDADKALSEFRRVLRPGGRAGVVVRSIDLSQHWNLDFPAALRERAETPPQSVAARGVADTSLYRRLRQAGFDDLTCFPSLVTLDRPGSPIWRYREDHVLSQLDVPETAAWNAAKAEAAAAGTLFTAHAMHCAVGTRPVSS